MFLDGEIIQRYGCIAAPQRNRAEWRNEVTDSPIELNLGTQIVSDAPINITRTLDCEGENFAGITDNIDVEDANTAHLYTANVGEVAVVESFYYPATQQPFSRWRSPASPSHSVGITTGGAGVGALEADGEQVVRWAWDAPGVAVLRGMGENRFSIESNGAMVHISNNSRFEYEGYGAAHVEFVGYETGTADGKSFLFNNHSQTSYADSVVKIGVDSAAQKCLEFGTWDGDAFTTNGFIDGTGQFSGRGGAAVAASGTIGFSSKIDTDSYPRFFMGVDAGLPFIGFGRGTTAIDTVLSRYSGGVKIKDASGANFKAIQGKLTTEANAASGTITPTHTLTLYDASGTAYKIPAIAA